MAAAASGYAEASSTPPTAPATSLAERTLPYIHTCSVACLGKLVHLHITLLEGSIFLYIGGPKLGFDDLQVAVPTPYDPLPSVASLRGELDGPSTNLAQKLSKRLGMMVYISFNLPEAEPEMLLLVQKECNDILDELLGRPSTSKKQTP
eukprot:TRINITY_DN37708_c0_g1_i1.p1 TRINITY_DN37708_c0_g1~~TRINITY_DN37708_c0_g1_i1.p1  ORF type:complete len:149 (+),score=27.00 TRINITY_DN37708_c0_g1_i1:68-514(+)